MRLLIRGLIGVWFLAIGILVWTGAFLGPAGRPPIAVGVAFAAPILVFAAAFMFSSAFRTYCLGIDPVFLVALHGWRFVGLGFLMAYCEHLLPAGFAIPAGIGDLVVAVLVPWIVLELGKDSGFMRGRFFFAWSFFGIADFADAMISGALHQGFLPAFQGSVPATLIARWPLGLIPCFFVPLLLITHIILLAQRSQSVHSYRSASAGNTLAALPLG